MSPPLLFTQMQTTGLLTPSAYRLRVAINVLSSLTFIAFMISSQDWKTNYTTIAALEWSFCMYIMAFEWLDSLTVSEKLSAAAIEKVDDGPMPLQDSRSEESSTSMKTSLLPARNPNGNAQGAGRVMYTVL